LSNHWQIAKAEMPKLVLLDSSNQHHYIAKIDLTAFGQADIDAFLTGVSNGTVPALGPGLSSWNIFVAKAMR
jgi:hypothetical protein